MLVFLKLVSLILVALLSFWETKSLTSSPNSNCFGQDLVVSGASRWRKPTSRLLPASSWGSAMSKINLSPWITFTTLDTIGSSSDVSTTLFLTTAGPSSDVWATIFSTALLVLDSLRVATTVGVSQDVWETLFSTAILLGFASCPLQLLKNIIPPAQSSTSIQSSAEFPILLRFIGLDLLCLVKVG